MSKLSDGENFLGPDYSGLDTSKILTGAEWAGSLKEPVVNWSGDMGYQEGQQITVIARSDEKTGAQDFYLHEGNVEVPEGVVGMTWKKIYELRGGKWQIVNE
jgi:hypothetical protein